MRMAARQTAMVRTTTAITTGLLLAGLLLAAAFSRTAAADEATAPTAVQLETLLRDVLAGKKTIGSPPWQRRQTAAVALLDFELVALRRVGPTRWRVDTNLDLDFGPPPPGVLGYERRRQGPYQLGVRFVEERLELLRFNPAGGVHALPGQKI